MAQTVKKNGKPEATKRATPAQDALEAAIIKFMRKGKEYTSRQVVEGLGRTPGGKEGGPVINVLKRMTEEGVVKQVLSETYRGNCWIRK